MSKFKCYTNDFKKIGVFNILHGNILLFITN